MNGFVRIREFEESYTSTEKLIAKYILEHGNEILNYSAQILGEKTNTSVSYTHLQFVNILWLIPILIQVFFISKKIYVELNYFDLRYKNRNNFLKNIFLCFIKEHAIYTTSFIVVQIIGLMILTGIPFKFDVGILELFCKYYIEIMFYIWLLILVSLVIQKYTISFLIELTLLLVLLNILKSSLFPIISLYYNYSFNFLTLPCICFVLHFIKKFIFLGIC